MSDARPGQLHPARPRSASPTYEPGTTTGTGAPYSGTRPATPPPRSPTPPHHIGFDSTSNATSTSSTRTLPNRLKSAGTTVVHHAKKHMGVGAVCAVAYMDPGNWGVDLQAGSQFGYRLLFVVLLAGLFAVFLQVLATRLGCVTGLDLASHCRVLLYDRPKHPRLYRWLGLYPLYILSEIAIISTDLAELLGSAIALCLLFPKLELWHGVLITALDVVFLLALRDPLRGTPVKMFEILIAGLVVAVLVCLTVVIAKVHVNWETAFQGFLPSKYIFKSGGLYTSVGILGATVMPHSLFLGSALATQNRLLTETRTEKIAPLAVASSRKSGNTLCEPSRFQRLLKSFVVLFHAPPPNPHATVVKNHSDRQNNSLSFVRAHLYHGIFDVVGSLLGFAVMINSMILILASAVFYYGNHDTAGKDTASLFDAYDIIRDNVGGAAATLFAIALLASGQSSSIIATMAGQAVSEGFLNWRVSPVVRRLLTRLIAIIPSMAVAIAVGRSGIDTLLVASQVVLSIVLPFITLPLICLTSSKNVMSVRKSELDPRPAESMNTWDDKIDFSSGKIVTAIGCIIWLVVLSANIYVIASLARGEDIS
ncbi:natural resistance-associated macrophage protein-domain-containing protein [Mycena rebaudengoi]|nr:natural resistance-associated macrophage protein-domain-containing protein [Mycena rebaudengoi]